MVASRLGSLARGFPTPLAIDGRERLRIIVGALLGVTGVAMAGLLWPPAAGLPWLIAPLGASAVLLFAMPASPLTQPWAVLGGNTLSACIGVACAVWVPWPAPAAGLAVALAIAAMLALRCLHPPGGAVALLAVVNHVYTPLYALWPVALESAVLVGLAMLYNPWTGRRYPHLAPPPTPAAARPAAGLPFTEADLNLALARYNQVLDVPADDLRALLQHASEQAQRRRLQTLRCQDVMTPEPTTVNFGTPLSEAWARLHQHRIKALPVTDRYGHVVGIVTQADFLRTAGLGAQEAPSATLHQRLQGLLRPTPGMTSDKPEVVGQIMTRQVRVASAERPLAELVPLFSQEGHHHLPVIGPANRLVGILTQTDVVAALARIDHLE